MTRTILLTLTLAFAVPAFAQETTATTAEVTATAETTTAETTTTVEAGVPIEPPRRTSEGIRNQFSNVLSEHPSELSQILKLDPSLLSNDAFLAGYPRLAEFVKENPEVRRNPRYYLATVRLQGDEGHGFEQVVEIMALGTLWAVLIFGFAWLVRTVIEQRRWNRLSRIQTEVHNKILDRFGTSAEVLEYIKSPAGTKFLESAPIAVRAEEPSQNAPLSRVMLSIQLGVVVAVGAIGMILVSFRFAGESGQGLFAVGMITFFVGAGFIASALVSLALSKRLGLWRGAAEQSESMS